MLSPKTRDAVTLGPWRRRRRMHRLLAELDAIDAGRFRSARDRRSAVGRQLVVVTVALALTGGIGFTVAQRLYGLRINDGRLTFAEPLGTPLPVWETGAHEFIETQPKDPQEPVAYDPCRPVEWEVNDVLAPPGADVLVKNAVARISAATGLQFTFRGHTDRDVSYGPMLMPRRSPALIAWTTPDVVPELAGPVAGVGGSVSLHDEFTGKSRYVTGSVALDAPQLSQVLTRPKGAAQVEAIILHELGHLVGLDHVNDPRELMHSDNVGALDLGPGDREGLALLGSGPCFH